MLARSCFRKHLAHPRRWLGEPFTFVLLAALHLLVLGCQELDTQQNTSNNVEFANVTERYLFGLRAITLNLSEQEVPAGRTVRLSANAIYKDGSSKAVSELITWQLSDPTLAKLLASSSDGHDFTTLAPGKLVFTAQFGEYSALAELNIGVPVVDILHTFPSALTLVKGQTAAVSLLASYSDRRVVDVTADAELSASGDSFISLTGLTSDRRLQFRGVDTGAGTLTAKFGGQTATAAVNVVSDALHSIKLTPQLSSIKLGDSQQFKAVGVTVDGIEYDLTSLAVWSSSNASKAAFANTATPGLLTALAAGELQVSATYQGKIATTTVTVHTPPVKALVIEPQASTSLPLGEQLALQALLQFHDGTSLDVTTSCQWASSDTGKAYFSDKARSGHILIGMQEGDAVVTALCLGYETQKAMTVSAPIVKSLIISAAGTGISSPFTSLSIAAGRSRNLSVWGVYSDNRSEDLTARATTTPGPASYSVTADVVDGKAVLKLSGLLEAVTSVTFHAAGASANLPLTIGTPELVSLSLTPATTSLALGRTQLYSVKAVYSHSPVAVTIANTAVHWSVSYNTGTYPLPPAFVHTAGTPGLVQTLRVGQATVRAELSGISATADLTITPAVIVDITLSATQSLSKGGSTAVTPVLKYSDNTTAAANTACGTYFFTFTATKVAGYETTPLSVNNDLCLSNTVTAIASHEGVVELAIKMEPTSGTGAAITSSSPLPFVIRTPCSSSPTVQAYGTLGDYTNIFCWYQGAKGNSCTQTCTAASRTYVADATTQLVGSSGTAAQCRELTLKFAAFSGITDFGDSLVAGPGLGCGVEDYGLGAIVGLREVGTATTAAGSSPDVYRICACTP